jgi:hypothetical protein
VVRDLLTDWALAEHQIPDFQFGKLVSAPQGTPTNPTAKKKKMVFTAFLKLLAVYDSIPREKLRRRKKLRLRSI